MQLFNYIPLKSIYQKFGVEKDFLIKPKESGYLIVEPSVIEGTGQDIIPFQYFPESIRISGSANYAVMQAKGAKPIKEYVGENFERIPLAFYLIDDVHSEVGEKPIPFGEKDLNSAILYFKDLVKPSPRTNRPPIVVFDWGVFSFKGVVMDYSIEIIESYPDMTPKVVNVSLNIEGEFE